MPELNWRAAKRKDKILTSEGRKLGTVKSVRGDRLLVGDAQFWLPDTAILSRQDGAAILGSQYDFLGYDGKAGSKNARLLGLMSTVILGAGAVLTFIALQNKQLRTKIGAGLLSVTSRINSKRRPVQTPATSAPSAASDTSSPGWDVHTSTQSGASRPESASDDVPPFNSMDLSNRVVTDVERELVALISAAFPERTLRVNALGVHRLEGGEVAALRFTLDETASSDLLLERVESPQAAPATLASEVLEDLRSQLPPSSETEETA